MNVVYIYGDYVIPRMCYNRFYDDHLSGQIVTLVVAHNSNVWVFLWKFMHFCPRKDLEFLIVGTY